MKRRTRPITRLLLLAGALATPLLAVETPNDSSEPTQKRKPARNFRLDTKYGRLPPSFEANQGQTSSQVKFLSRGRGFTLFLTPTDAVLNLSGSDRGSALRLNLVGANRRAKISGVDELPGRSNYFLGNDPTKWRTNVPHYAKVRYEDIYPGIDLVYYGTEQGQLEYDFIVAPGADPAAIRLEVEGAQRVDLSNDGDLLLSLAEGELRLRRPVVYQEAGRAPVAGRYVLRGRRIGVELAAYDRRLPLIVDPVLEYSTYLGGNGADFGLGVAVDTSGNAYVTGSTDSTNFPTVNPFQGTCNSCGGGGPDAFVTKFNADGSALVYSTYLGGGSQDTAVGISVDTSGNAHITGHTLSTNFPTTMGAFDTSPNGDFDVFVAKLGPTGSTLVYGTYVGGSGGDLVSGFALDTAGNAYVTGLTFSANFPTASPFQAALAGPGGCPGFSGISLCDAFVTKVNPTGSALVYSTYLGGNGFDFGRDIAVDTAGNAYVTGSTESTNFPTANPFQAANAGFRDAFVTKFNPSGSALVYSTYLGGSGNEAFSFSTGGITVDTAGNAYVTGQTESTDFPTVNSFQAANAGGFGCFCDAFVTKLNPAGSAPVYSTYLGGNRNDMGLAIAVDASGNTYVTGRTDSTDFPTANPIQGACLGCGSQGPDAFVTLFNPTGSAVLFSTYLGGDGFETSQAIALDAAGNAYIAGQTNSTTFPTTNALQAVTAGGSDAFVAKISSLGNPLPALISLFPESAPAGGMDFMLTVSGSNFIEGSVVRWKGTDRITSFVSASQLTAQIPDTDLAGSGSVQVTVFNPAPGGGLSNALTFTVSLRNPLPTITGLSPPGAVGGSPSSMLAVNGSNFVFNSQVHWDGAPRTTSFQTSSQLQAAIPATDLEVADIGAHQVTVMSPSPGGGASNAVNFNVQNVPNPVPFISNLSPPGPLVAGSVRTAFTLNVFDGVSSSFRNTSVVRWNGMNRTTSFVGTGQLTVTIPASDVATAGTAQVTVFTPMPGGGTSNVVNFFLINPAPTLTSLSPNSATSGDPAFTLTLIASSFIPSSVVRWNGSNRSTTFIGSNQLRAAIPASDLISPGSVSVTVLTPAPGGGESVPQSFTINSAAQASVSADRTAQHPQQASLPEPERVHAVVVAPLAPAVRGPAPVIDRFEPGSVVAGSGTLKLSVRGENFTEESMVRLKGKDLPTKFISETELEVELFAAALAQPGELKLNVFTPGPTGGTSKPATLTIAPQP